MRKCTDCKYAILQDYGYSNWTVEGTDFYCAKHLHPDDGVDAFYGEAAPLAYAAECAGFIAGNAIYLDVEDDGKRDLEGEQKEIYEAYLAPALSEDRT